MLPVSLLPRKPQLGPFTCSNHTILISSVAARAHPQLSDSAGDKFSLNDDQEGGGELLTHMGRSLGAGDTHEVICCRLWPHAAYYWLSTAGFAIMLRGCTTCAFVFL